MPTTPPTVLTLPLQPKSPTLTLFSLPPEIRQQIYHHLFHASPIHVPSQSLSILLVSRQLHTKTRTLPFMHPAFTFSFPPRFGSSTPLALQILRRMTPLQWGWIRRMRLELTQADLGAGRRLVGLFDLFCEEDGGLRELAVEISTVGELLCLPFAVRSMAEVLCGEEPWVKRGLVMLRSLRRLRIVMCADGMAVEVAVEVLQERLREEMGWVRREDVVVELGRGGDGGRAQPYQVWL